MQVELHPLEECRRWINTICFIALVVAAVIFMGDLEQCKKELIKLNKAVVDMRGGGDR